MLLDSSGLAYEEDTGLSNVKLVVGFAGVGASLVSHVYPAAFPKNWCGCRPPHWPETAEKPNAELATQVGPASLLRILLYLLWHFAIPAVFRGAGVHFAPQR